MQRCLRIPRHISLDTSSLNRRRIIIAGVDCLTKEHIVYAHPAVVCHIKTLFDAIVSHGFVPDIW